MLGGGEGRLRKWLTSNGEHVATVRGKGYIFHFTIHLQLTHPLFSLEMDNDFINRAK